MRSYPTPVLWYGRDEPPVEARLLRAGPVTALLSGCDLRYVRRDGLEVVRRLYLAVRDQNWNTIPGAASDLQVDAGDDRFRVGFRVGHRQDGIDFHWRGEITGAPDGTISYAFEGTSVSEFRYNRIGLCVLHPCRESAGRPYEGRTPVGAIHGVLPLRIAPQRIFDGTYHALFPAVGQLSLTLDRGMTARFEFEGDLFEMEDQRNWTHASFKTYCTPLALPWPRTTRAGQAHGQRVTVRTDAGPAEPEPARAGENRISLDLGQPTRQSLPALGLGMASHDMPLSAREAEMLRAVRPAHLRADLRLRDPDYPRALMRAFEACRALDCGLELALFVTNAADAELQALAGRLAAAPPLARVLVFHAEEESTGAGWIRLARERLSGVAAGVPFAGGANAYFCELNRSRPEVDAMDAVAYSLNPQVHAFDESSLVETQEAQGETVRSARAFCGDLPVIVTPVTLKPRFNANATAPEEPAPGRLPAPVDARQMSLFGAAWTVGSVKYLAEAGAAAVTWYETTGWRGVMESEAGPPLPDLFPSEPGMVFPLYHVFADLAEWESAEIVACSSRDPLAVVGLAVREGERAHLLIANVTATDRRVRVGPLAVAEVRVRRLNVETSTSALFDPERFRSATEPAATTRGELEIDLAPYETVRIDAPAATGSRGAVGGRTAPGDQTRGPA